MPKKADLKKLFFRCAEDFENLIPSKTNSESKNSYLSIELEIDHPYHVYKVIRNSDVDHISCVEWYKTSLIATNA